MMMPVTISDYTDFYASVFHATNVGSMFRPDNPLLPNYKWVPIGYHGRASSIVISGTPVKRPSGQRKPPTAETPSFGPCAQLDYELEVGAVIGQGNALGDNDSDRPKPSSISSGFACRTIGRHATYKHGSISRSVPSLRRISRHRFPRGL